MIGWIGVDLDGTLAEYHGWKGDTHIGKPIPAMVKRIKSWINDGETVKILTARVAVTDDHDKEHARKQTELIQDWCAKHIGQLLEITATKDHDMKELWDDRSIQVLKNKGMPVQPNNKGNVMKSQRLKLFNKSLTADFAKLRKSEVEYGVNFFVSGQDIKNAVLRKIPTLEHELEQLKQATGIQTEDIEMNPQMQDSPADWQVRDKENEIKRLKRTAKYIDCKKKFRLSDWDLERFGL